MSASGSVQSLDVTLRGARADETFARRYDVDNLRTLGRGAMGTVAAAFDRLAGRWVAVKVFHNPTHQVRERLQSEVLNAERIHSDYVVRVRTPHTSADGELVWLEMELVEGVNLDQELAEQAGGIPQQRAFALAVAITEAIAAAHAAGVIHRDVKPENILLPASGEPLVKVADFGISRHDEQVLMTKSGSLMGTPIYAPPETFRGETLGNPADIYSLGLVFYRLFGRNNLPYDLHGCSLAMVGDIHKNRTPAKLREFNPDALPELENLLLRMVAKETYNRPPISEVLTELRRIAGRAAHAEAPVGTPNTVVPARPTSPQPLWLRRLAIPGGVAITLLVVVIVVLSRDPRQPTTSAAAANSIPTPRPTTMVASLAPPIRIEKDELGNIVLVNAGGQLILVSEIVLEGQNSNRYVAKPGEQLEPFATLGLTLEALDPVPPKELGGQLAVTYTANGKITTQRYPWPPRG